MVRTSKLQSAPKLQRSRKRAKEPQFSGLGRAVPSNTARLCAQFTFQLYQSSSASPSLLLQKNTDQAEERILPSRQRFHGKRKQRNSGRPSVPPSSSLPFLSGCQAKRKTKAFAFFICLLPRS
jgi:hypothetical protein